MLDNDDVIFNLPSRFPLRTIGKWSKEMKIGDSG